MPVRSDARSRAAYLDYDGFLSKRIEDRRGEHLTADSPSCAAASHDAR